MACCEWNQPNPECAETTGIFLPRITSVGTRPIEQWMTPQLKREVTGHSHASERQKSSLKQAPYAPIWRCGRKSRMDLRIGINNELRRIRRKIEREKIPAKKMNLIKAYEDLVETLKSP